MKIYTLVILILCFSIIYCYLPHMPRGWKPCNRFWTRRCNRYCLRKGFSLGLCWINKRWYTDFRGMHDSTEDWDNYYRNSLNNYNNEGIFLQIENRFSYWKWSRFVNCRCKFYNNGNEEIFD